MIRIWHLLWIIPLSVTAGFFLAALMAASKKPEPERPEEWAMAGEMQPDDSE